MEPADKDAREIAALQRRVMLLLALASLISAVTDGILWPPDDGGWHIGTALLSTMAFLLCGVGYLINLSGRLTTSGWLLIGAILVTLTGTLITGTPIPAIIATLGGFTLLMVLPQNVLPSGAPESRRWVLLVSALYVVGVFARHTLRADILPHEEDIYFTLAWGPIMFALVRAMSDRLSRKIGEALSESEETRHELAEVNERLWRRSIDLSEALELAHFASEAKGRFLANMSHELRTPLNAILGYAEIVQEELGEWEEGEPLPQELIEDLQHIEVAGQHLLRLISDILDISRIEAGQTLLELEPVRVDTLLDELRNVMLPQAQKKHNTLLLSIHDDARLIETDVMKLRQIFFNLIGNALKFTSNGTITLRARPLGEEMICFEVQDTGPGIPLNKQEKIFEPFEQVDSSSTRVHGGAGLGLALCKQLAELLGGKISLQSTPGKGSTFSFTLPRHPARHNTGRHTAIAAEE